jgi:cell wall-associated NlpC family hydrolase
MPNRNLRNLIVSEARSWIGTRFHHQGRLKKLGLDKGGVDCIGLVLGVFDTLGINFGGVSIRNFDKKDYAKIPDGKILKEEFFKYLKEINPTEVESGDILMFKFDKEPQHVGIVVKEEDNLTLYIVICRQNKWLNTVLMSVGKTGLLQPSLFLVEKHTINLTYSFNCVIVVIFR